MLTHLNDVLSANSMDPYVYQHKECVLKAAAPRADPQSRGEGKVLL